MAYLRQILHLVHLTCFSFILGNMINEYFIGKMKLEKEQYTIIGKLFILTSSICILIISIIYYYSTTQNIYKGTIKIKNQFLSNPIYIYTDNNGFTHIKAKNKKDAFFGIGISHARDRLFQMDMLRRFGSGKLSEIFGKKTLEVDKLMRTIGFRRTAEKDVFGNIFNPNHTDINNLMSVYAEGINYWANTHKLPVEYYLLNFKFENWTVIDSFVIFRYMDYFMICDHSNELLNHLVHDILGDDFYNLLYKSTLFDFPYFNDTIISKEEIEEMKLNNKNYNDSNDNAFNYYKIPEINYKVSQIEESEELTFEKLDEHASNSWVIHGNYTNTSKPIFTNDPHLGNSIPGIHYIAKLYIENDNNEDDIYVGTFIPGSPFLIIGNNKYFSFGFTTDNRDKSDFVEEKLDNDDISKAKYYYVDNEKIPLIVLHENIKVKGNFDYDVKLTRNGPILEKFNKELNKIGYDYIYNSTNKNISNALSLHLYSFNLVLDITFFYNIMFGKSKEDFLNNLDNYAGPSFSFSWQI